MSDARIIKHPLAVVLVGRNDVDRIHLQSCFRCWGGESRMRGDIVFAITPAMIG